MIVDSVVLRKLRTLLAGVLVAISVCGPCQAEFKDNFEKVYDCSAADATALIKQAAGRPGGESLQPLVDAPLAAYAGGCYLTVTNSYSRGEDSDGIRFLSLRMTIVNRGQAPQTFHKDHLVLTSGGEKLVMGQIPSRLQQQRFIGLQHLASKDVPTEIKVEPGKAVTFWCLFAPLDPENIPTSLQLELESESGEKLSVNVTQQQAARLAMTQERLGPRQALPVFTIHGELNTVNAGVIAEKVAGLVNDGLERAIITFAKDAAPVDMDLQIWLLRSGTDQDPNNVSMERLPVLPKLRQLILAQIPEESEQVIGLDLARGNVFDSTQRAVTASLSGLLRQLTPTELLAELRGGHPWTKTAVLESSGDRLGTEAWPLLAEMSRSNDQETRRLALAGLAHQEIPQARAILDEALNSSDREFSEAALRAILSREDLASREQVRAALAAGKLPLKTDDIVRAIAEFYHPQWNSLLLSAVRDPDPVARRNALETLRTVGHPQLGDLCLDRLADESEDVRQTAFHGLAGCPETRYERAAVEYALKRLSDGHPGRPELELVQRLKVTQAAPLLISLIEHKSEENSRLVDVLGAVANLEQLRWLVSRLDSFEPDEQASVMELAKRLPPSEQIEVARRAISIDSVPLKNGALELLQRIATPEAVELIAGRLRSTSDDEMERACYGLAQIGTPPAMLSLRKFRDEIYEQERRAAYRPVHSAFELWRSGQPGTSYIAQGNEIVGEEDGKVKAELEAKRITREEAKARRKTAPEKSLKYFDLAIEMNPEFSYARSVRGNIYLRMEKLDKARADFEAAYKLDNFDSQAVTGVAIAQAIGGEWEKGLETVLDKFSFFKEQNAQEASIFTYNTACVMGRSIEFLEKQPDSPEKADRIADLRRRAVKLLDESLDLGFDDMQWMQEDPDLKPLQSLPEFLELIPEGRRIDAN